MQGKYQPSRSGTAIGCGRALPSAVALLCLLTSTSAAALGLGGAEVASRLNQPLDARIPLHDVGARGPDAIEVGLASRARLREAGLEGARYLDGLRFRVEPGAAGGHYVRVTSEEPIAEPFLRFLLRVETGRGRMIRDYTLLLDPPAAATGDGATATAASATPAARPRTSRGEAAAPRPRTWGPVATGSSAWEVAAAVRAEDASIYQTMIALLRANPGAFRDGDLGGLRAGVRLTIPAPAEVRAIPQSEAVALYREHLGTAVDAADAADGAQGADAAGTEATASTDAAAAASGPVAAVKRPPGLSPIRSADAAEEDGDAEPPAGRGAGAAPRLPVRLDQRLVDLAASVDAVEARVATEGDSIARALSSQSGQLDRVEELLAGVRQDVIALREVRPPAAPAGAAGLSYRTGVLLAVGGLLLGALGGYAAGRGLPARGRTRAAAAPEASTVAAHRPFGNDDAPVPAAAAPPPGDELPAERATRAGPAATGGTLPDEGERMDISELVWDQAEGAAGPSPSEDDNLFWADIYIAENLPREAEKIIRDAISLYGERPGYRVKLLEALYNAGAREQYLREAMRYRAAAIDEGTWDEVVRMGRTLAPDHPPFRGAAGEAAAAAERAGTGTDADAGEDDAVPAPGTDDGPLAPDLSQLEEAVGDDGDEPGAGPLLWEERVSPHRVADEAADKLDFDPLQVEPAEDPSGDREGAQPRADSADAGDDEARGGGGDDAAGEEGPPDEGDGFRRAAGRR